MHPRLRRIPDPPMPRIVGLAAVRKGSEVDVSWRMDRSAHGVQFVVFASETRELREPLAPKFLHGSAKRTYRVQLHHVPSKAHYVLIDAERGDGHSRHARVRLR